MRCQEFFLTDDAVDDLVELEACVLTYQNISLVEVLDCNARSIGLQLCAP